MLSFYLPNSHILFFAQGCVGDNSVTQDLKHIKHVQNYLELKLHFFLDTTHNKEFINVLWTSLFKERVYRYIQLHAQI